MKLQRMKLNMHVLPVLFLTAGCASAAITYVDATAVTTTVNGAAMLIQNQNASGSYVAGTHYNVSDDDFTGGGTDWHQRDPFANGGNAFQMASVPLPGVLNTNVSGLSNGIYQVYAYFWDDSGVASNWDMAAQLNSGGYIDKAANSPGVIAASSQAFTTVVLPTESTRTLYAINLGTFTGTGFTVDIMGGTAGVVGGSVTDVRTWYDGIGYEFVAVPEPKSLGLLGLSGLLLFRRRRHD